MDDKFELSESQETFLKEKMGIEDLTNVKLIFEVDSSETQSISEAFTNKSSKFSFVMCPCPGGGWSWLCCE